MIKKFVLTGLILAYASLNAQAQEITPGLECNYTGTWSMKGAKGQFSWHGFWFQGDGGWIFRGNGQSNLGKSHLKGACGSGECEWGQDFISGSSKNKAYTYRHQYKDPLGEKGPLNMSFSGSWSQGNSYTADENWKFVAIGNWKAQPKCKAVANIGDLEKKLGWQVW